MLKDSVTSACGGRNVHNLSHIPKCTKSLGSKNKTRPVGHLIVTHSFCPVISSDTLLVWSRPSRFCNYEHKVKGWCHFHMSPWKVSKQAEMRLKIIQMGDFTTDVSLMTPSQTVHLWPWPTSKARTKFLLNRCSQIIKTYELWIMFFQINGMLNLGSCWNDRP